MHARMQPGTTMYQGMKVTNLTGKVVSPPIILNSSPTYLLFPLAPDDPELVMGMPVGIQIVGGRFGEEKAIAVAKIIEDLLAKL